MDQRLPVEAYALLIGRIDPGARLVGARRLTGGVSADVVVVDVAWEDGRTATWVVRQHGAIDRARNAEVARDEFRLLQIAAAHGLAVPTPRFLDESCSIFPAPVVVIDYVEGETAFQPADLGAYLAQAADALASVHAIPVTAEVSFLPRSSSTVARPLAALDDALQEGRIRAALAAAEPISQTNASVVLHGDFWPGNLLWRDGALVTVIDWEDAQLGDPLADLANTRLELLWFFGHSAMDDFTDRYLARHRIDRMNLPYWELRAALRPCGKLATWGLESDRFLQMQRRHAWFIDQAIAAIHRAS